MASPLRSLHDCGMDHDTLDTLRRAAEHRVSFLAWLAGRLETDDDLTYRREAALVLRQLVEDATPVQEAA